MESKARPGQMSELPKSKGGGMGMNPREIEFQEQLAAERERHDRAQERAKKWFDLLATERARNKTLVDTLEEIANSNEDCQYLSRLAAAALAKVHL